MVARWLKPVIEEEALASCNVPDSCTAPEREQILVKDECIAGTGEPAALLAGLNVTLFIIGWLSFQTRDFKT